MQPDAVPKLQPAPKSRKDEHVDDDDIPLKFLRNSQWANKRIGKNRPSPLPVRSSARRKSMDSDSDRSESSHHSLFPFIASPFVPTTIAETGEDETSEVGPSSASTMHAVLEGKGDSGEAFDESNENVDEHATDQDRLLPPQSASRRSIMAKSNDGSPRWCRKCEAWKADRAHHCRFCHACTLKSELEVWFDCSLTASQWTITVYG